MKIKFNGKIYEKNKSVKQENGNGLGRFCIDVFKYYLSKHKSISYEGLQSIFNKLHDGFSSDNSNKKVLMNEEEYTNWYNNYSQNDTKRDTRYFGYGGYSEPINYNGEKIYFTTQWGNRNIENIIQFAKAQNYDIEILEPDIEQPTSKQRIKNIILYGVPGVGKTYSHKMLIDLIESKAYSDNQIFNQLQTHQHTSNFEIASNENRVQFLTFHQSFGYEDFLEGFRPNENGEIKLQDGVFKDFCDKAEKNKEKNFYFVIDEINRGNISKIFGELITLIEEDKRDTLHVTLPYSKKTFSIPSNLYIIGTMNSTDKSIALIDIALRRRFTFLKIKPNHELISDKNAQQLMQGLNEKIKETLGEEHLIGHSYFMNITNKEELQFVVNYKIKPLMEEYFYGDDTGFNSVLNILDSYIENI